MSRPGVTYSDVSQAANRLMGQGRHPTIEQVRLVLGTGSSTTIANHLKQWKISQDETSLFVIKEKIPDELISLLSGLWQRVIEQSEERLQRRLQEMEQELEKYKRNNKRWQKLYMQWMKERERLLTMVQALQKGILLE